MSTTLADPGGTDESRAADLPEPPGAVRPCAAADPGSCDSHAGSSGISAP